ncbi:DNA polymerase III subunit alpha [Patulibacter americanus]|uniref:DNA polymerase III subunit alpha n=1 Tax=Patulibacter americanus TaxID=588672 RepID=UPI0003B6D04E|nr:DNA polymerase III subunit alpha [Patulibacter americanus]
MSSGSCVHLHVHSEYSLLDGQPNIGKLVKRAAELDQPAIGLTDHGVMNGAVELYKAAKKEGIKPVIGCELYLVDDHASKEKAKPNHLTVIAQSTEGYRNLMRLSSLGFTDGYRRGKPCVDLKQMEEMGSGLIVLTGCLASKMCTTLANDDVDGARQHADDLFNVVGRDNVYFEVQKNGIDLQDKCNEGIVRIARETGRPLVGTTDVHYLHKHDYDTHEALLCVQTQSTLANPKMSFSTNEFYVKSTEEMAAQFAEWPDALPTTLEIAERCDVHIPLNEGSLLPRFLPEGQDEQAYLHDLVDQGLKARYGDPIPAAARERADMELGVINKMGYDAYFLIVHDFVKWSKDHDISVGPGRGSAAGSIISYVLGITDLDPLHYDLLFERFLNPDRVSMPDIDIDFSVRGREEVMKYVTDKYGKERVAQIVTFGRMLPRNATKDSARVQGFDYATGDRLAKLIPDPIMGKTPPLEKCLAEGTELRAAYDSDPVAKQVLDVAMGLEGTVRNAGIHAAAVVISDRDLSSVVPIQIADSRTVDERGDKIFKRVTQFPMGPVEELGLLKMDFLGLRNLDVIQDALKIIAGSSGEKIDIADIPLDDPKTYEMLARGDSVGVFQFESEGMRKAMRQVNPTEFDDLIALVALYRPGAMDQIPTYAAGKHDPNTISIPDPRLQPIIGPTKGVILYQEQSMRIARDLAGFTPGQADDLRKAIGKKKLDKMAELEPAFREGCLQSGTNAQVVDWLWQTNLNAANYSFNKSHAACYGLVSYRTAWLKANYPAEYMAALLSSVMSTKDKVPFFLNTCEEMGIPVLPPDVNESDHEFTVHDGAIRFGLDAVKGVGHSAVEAIKEARDEGPFTSLWDFCERVDFKCVNGKALDSLIRCGAFMSTGATRQGMLAVVEDAQQVGKKVQQDAAAGQGSIFDFGDGLDDGAGAGSGSKASTHPPIPTAEFDQRELLAMEKETIGLFLSAHPLKDVRDALAKKTECGLADLRGRPHDSWVQVGGMVADMRRINTRKGDVMLRGILEDTESSIDLVVFPKGVPELEPILQPDSVVLLRGRLDLKDDERAALLVSSAKVFEPSAKEIEAASGAADARRAERVAAAAPTELYVRVDGSAIRESALGRLKHLLRDHEGEAAIVLTIGTSSGPRTLRLGEGFRVTPSPTLTMELERLFGEGALSAGAAPAAAVPAVATDGAQPVPALV